MELKHISETSLSFIRHRSSTEVFPSPASVSPKASYFRTKARNQIDVAPAIAVVVAGSKENGKWSVVDVVVVVAGTTSPVLLAKSHAY